MRTSIAYVLVILLISVLSVSFLSREGIVQAMADGGRDFPEPTLDLDNIPLEAGDGVVTSYADMLEGVTPAVVAVYTSRIVPIDRGRDFRRVDPMEEFLRRFYGMPPQDNGEGREFDPESDESRKEPSGVGSGVIVSPEGYVLTNNHVTEVGRNGQAADEISVKLSDGREYIAEIVGRDPSTDIAVLKIEDEKPFPFVTIGNSDLSRVGDVVFALGNPLNVGLTVTSGIVSATGRTDLGILRANRFERSLSFEDFIQTDAAINRGNSGGPLVDAGGRMIGINTAIISGTGGNIGIGFAIPVNLARVVTESLIRKGVVQYGYLGVLPDNLNRDLAESFGLSSTAGAVIRQVEPDTPAEAAGLLAGDIILQVDRRSIQTADELRTAIALKEPGSEVVLSVFRDGEQLEIVVQLGDRSSGVVADTGGLRGRLPGLRLSPLTDALREQFEIDERVNGVVITEITERTRLNQRMREGMVIARVNNLEVRTTSDLEAGLSAGLNRLYVWYDGVYGFLTVRLEK